MERSHGFFSKATNEKGLDSGFENTYFKSKKHYKKGKSMRTKKIQGRH